MNRKVVYLTGFMASGKSTIGPILANTVGWNFFDLDKEIEKKENKKIRTIFEENGEKYFRKKETDVLKDLSCNKNLIVALGGGTLVSSENRGIIKESGLLIYLKCSPETAYNRLKHKRDRPILTPNDSENGDENNLRKKINELMQVRIQYYSLADYSFDTEGSNIGQTVDLIARLIQKI